MHVVFVEPRFPANQKLFVKALAEVGATITAIGEGSKDSLDDELKHWLTHYEEVRSVVDEEGVMRAVRFIQGRKQVDRLEAVVEAHIMPVARVREAAGIPGTSVRTAFLCRDKPAMKQLLREGGIPCAASTGASSVAEVREFVEQVGFPIILKPRAGAGASGAARVDSIADLEPALRQLGAGQPGWSVAVEEFIEGHEGFYDTLAISGNVVHDFVSHYYPNVLEAMRHALDLAPVRGHQPHRHGAGLRGAQAPGPQGGQPARHRDLGHPYGMVLRTARPQVLRDRLPAARRARLGPLQRRQRHGPVPRVGDGRHPRPPVAERLAPLLGRHHRAAPGPRRPDRRVRGAQTPSARRSGPTSSTPTCRPRARRPSRSRPATWPTPGCA